MLTEKMDYGLAFLSTIWHCHNGISFAGTSFKAENYANTAGSTSLAGLIASRPYGRMSASHWFLPRLLKRLFGYQVRTNRTAYQSIQKLCPVAATKILPPIAPTPTKPIGVAKRLTPGDISTNNTSSRYLKTIGGRRLTHLCEVVNGKIFPDVRTRSLFWSFVKSRMSKFDTWKSHSTVLAEL